MTGDEAAPWSDLVGSFGPTNWRRIPGCFARVRDALSCPNRRKHACEIKLRKFSIIRTGLGNLAAEQIGAASARPIPALPITVLVQVSGDLLRAAALPPEGWRYRDRDRNMLKTMAICPEW